MPYIITIIICFLGTACSNNPIASNPAAANGGNETSARPATPAESLAPTAAEVTQQNPKIALLQLEQGFNDLGSYVVYGRIKNISGSEISDTIRPKATLYTSNGVLIDTETGLGIYTLQSSGETTFSLRFYSFELRGQTPDPTRTVLDILINGYRVSYLNRAQIPYHSHFDFRFSNWGDSEETVASNEPGGFRLEHIAGGKSTKESEGYATAVLTFSDTVEDSVEVAYLFRGGELYGGWYDFPITAPADKMSMIQNALTERYGLGELSDGSWTWIKGERTFVFLFSATDWRGIRIAYVDATSPFDTEAEDAYNRLPLRVVVPE